MRSLQIYTVIIMLLLAVVAVSKADTVPPSPAISVAPIAAEVVASPSPTVFMPSKEAEAYEPPQFVKQAMVTIQSLPKVGPIFLSIMKWLGVIASIMTTLVIAFFSIMKTLSGVANISGANAIAEKVDAIYLKVSPYLKFASVFNAQKDETGKLKTS